MGEMAEWVLEGGLCEGCGVYLDDGSPGYTRRCVGCSTETAPRAEVPKHRCHATNCRRTIPAKLFMCTGHWRQLSSRSRKLILRNYRPGQEIDKSPSPQYLEAARAAIAEVASRSTRPAQAVPR